MRPIGPSLLLALLLAQGACATLNAGSEDDDGSGDTDADSDTDSDTGSDTEPPFCTGDLMCLPFAPAIACCNNTCVNPLNNVEHCGSCNHDCMATQEGNNCTLGSCRCGIAPVGCEGFPTECCVFFLFTWVCDTC